MKKVIYISIAATFLLLIHACTDKNKVKQETTFNKLANKWWTLKKVTLNGFDYTDSVKQKIGNYQIYMSNYLYRVDPGGIELYDAVMQSDTDGTIHALWEVTSVNSVNTFALAPNNGGTSTHTFTEGYADPWKFSNNYNSILKLNNLELEFSRKSNSGDTLYTNYFTSN